jgi:peptidyl-prolyl cis-trans isomerase D
VDKQAIPYEVGPITEDSFDSEIGKVVFGLAQDEISPPIETPLGWDIFRVKKIIPAKKEDFAKIKNKLADEVARNKLSEKMHNLVKEISHELELGRSIDEIASKYSLEVSHKTESNKKDNHGDDYEQIFSRGNVLQKIFNEENSDIQIISSDDNSSFMLLKVHTISKGKLKSFEEAKGDIATKYTEEQLDKKTLDKILEIRKKLIEDSEIDLTRVATKKIRFSRLSKNDEMPICIEDAIIQTYKNRIFAGITGPCKEDDYYHIATLKEIDFSKEPTAEQMQILAHTVNTIYNQLVFSQFLEELKKNYKVHIDKKFDEYLRE